MFVDFETISDLCDTTFKSSFNIIFMIGVGYIENGKWVYKQFTIDQLTKDSELEIMTNFIKFYEEMGKPNIYYWYAEDKFWNKSISQYKSHKLSINTWVDLHNLFKTEGIVVRGAFSFGLKDIVANMKKHGFIDTPLDSECQDGMTAMVDAYKYYKNKIGNLDDIITYNEFDCRALYDILAYLRKNH